MSKENVPTAPDGIEKLAINFDIRQLPTGFLDNPFPVYDALLQHCPVHAMPGGGVILSCHADLDQVYKNPKQFSSDKKVEFKPKYGDSLLYEHHTTSLVFNDPPLHTRVRRLIAGALTPRAIAQMEPGLRRLVDELLSAMQAKAARGEAVDIIEDYASAIPVEIIGNLLNVPHADRGPLRGWSLAILGALEPVVTPEAFAAGNAALAEFIVYLEGLIADRRAKPGNPELDVLTRLIQGEPNEQGEVEALTPKELLHNCVFLLNAGHETTTNLIGNGIVTLIQHPDQLAKLQAQPDLIKTAVEEVLRVESSNQLGNRITTEEVSVGGVTLPAGTQVTLCMGAANRDPAQFPDPHRFDIERKPNAHFAFAGGIHRCAGLQLARLEGQIAIGEFFKRFPNAQLHGEPVRGGRARFRGFLAVPCRLV